jgi:hypothetical protein
MYIGLNKIAKILHRQFLVITPLEAYCNTVTLTLSYFDRELTTHL